MSIRERINLLAGNPALGEEVIGADGTETKSNCHGTIIYLLGIHEAFSIWPSKTKVKRYVYDANLNKRVYEEEILAQVCANGRPGMIHPYFMTKILRREFSRIRREDAVQFDVISFWSKHFCGNLDGPKKYSLEHSALWTPNLEGEIFHQTDSGGMFEFCSIRDCIKKYLDKRDIGRRFYTRFHRLRTQ